ncbi:MAG: hypothetical protein WEB63_08995 [Cucumibacter sp.]
MALAVEVGAGRLAQLEIDFRRRVWATGAKPRQPRLDGADRPAIAYLPFFEYALCLHAARGPRPRNESHR